MSTKPSYQITKHPIGSLKEVWTISWPLILGLISNGTMIVVDRLMLGKYSLNAMNAAATASAAAFAIFVLPIVVAGISEVFVGRAHGRGEPEKMGQATWQMIWFSLFLAPLFFIVGRVLGPLLLHNVASPKEASCYFYTIVNFGTVFCLGPALMGFYIGQGKVRIITITVALANIANYFFDKMLIFGTPFIAPMGVKGAAIATVMSQGLLALTFFIFFIRRKNRRDKGAANWKIDVKLIVESLKVGTPASFAHLSEYVSYFFFLKLMGSLGSHFLTIAVLLNTVYMIIYFVIEGISKAVTAICSNLIGAGQYHLIRKNILSTCILHTVFVVGITAILMLGFPDIYIGFIGASDRAILNNSQFIKDMYVATIYMCIFYLFDGLVWAFVGLFTSASDTKFIMKVECFVPWLLFLLPVYVATKYFQISSSGVWLLVATYGLLHLAIYGRRYLKGGWKGALKEPEPVQENSLPL